LIGNHPGQILNAVFDEYSALGPFPSDPFDILAIDLSDPCHATTITWTPKAISSITQTVFDPTQTLPFDTTGLTEAVGTCGAFKFELDLASLTVPTATKVASVITLPVELTSSLNV